MKILDRVDKEFVMAVSIFSICVCLLGILILIGTLSHRKVNDMSAAYLTDLKDNNTSYEVYAKVLNEYVNLREDPNTDYDPMGSVKKGEIYQVVEIIEKDNDRWYRVLDKNNNMGYLSYHNGKYLEIFFEKDLELDSFRLNPKKPVVEELTTTTTTKGTTIKTKKTKSTTLSKATETTTTTTKANLTQN